MSKTFSKYQIQKKLPEESAHYASFEAVQAGLDRQVELRILQRRIDEDGPAYQRFQREFRVLAALDHPAIIKVLDLGMADGRAYYTTDLRDSRSLRELLDENRRGLDQDQVLAWLLSILEALALLHSKGVLHRDVSLDSIRIEQKRDQAYLSNFSLLKILKLPSLTEKGFRSAESGACHTPEDEEGWDQDERTDVYLVGTVLYQCLVGRRIPTSAEAAVGKGHPPFEIPPPSEFRNDIPPQIDELVASLLAYRPEDRPASVQHVLGDLKKLQEKLKLKSLARTVGLPAATVSTVRSQLQKKGEEDAEGAEGEEGAEGSEEGETELDEAAQARALAAEATANAVQDLIAITQEWLEKPRNKKIAAGVLGLCVLGMAGVNWLTTIDPYDGADEGGITRTRRRRRRRTKKLDSTVVRKKLSDVVQQTMEDSTTPRTFEARWDVLKNFVKLLPKEARQKHFPPSVMANLRVSFYRNPDGAAATLDKLLAKAMDLADQLGIGKK